MQLLKQSTAVNIPFLLVLSSDSKTGATGITPTVTLSKNAASFASAGGSVTEIGNGWYNLAGTTTDTATLGALLLHATGTGCDPTDEKCQVVLDLPGASVSSVTGAVGSVTGAVGSVTGSVGSVTGAVGSVTGAVGSVTAGVTVTTNNDKTGYSLSVTPPTAVQIRTEMDSNSTKLANLDAAVSSRSTYAGGAVASVTGAVGSVTGSVGSVTGSVGSVTGAVGSVTAAVTVGTNNDKTGYALATAPPTATENADALLKRDMSAVTGEAARSPLNAFRAIRNKVSRAGTLVTVKKEDDSTTAWSATIATDGALEPIATIDPS